MLIVRFTRQSLMEITSKGLLFRDEKHSTHYIDFEICSKNWIAYAKSELGIQDIDEKKNTCVGIRDVFARPAYTEFFSDPHVRFEFRFKLFRESPYRQARFLENALYDAGWATVDMN